MDTLSQFNEAVERIVAHEAGGEGFDGAPPAEAVLLRDAEFVVVGSFDTVKTIAQVGSFVISGIRFFLDGTGASLDRLAEKLDTLDDRLFAIENQINRVEKELRRLTDAVGQGFEEHAGNEVLAWVDTIADNFDAWVADPALRSSLAPQALINLQQAARAKVRAGYANFNTVGLAFAVELDMAALLDIGNRGACNSAERYKSYFDRAIDPEQKGSIAWSLAETGSKKGQLEKQYREAPPREEKLDETWVTVGIRTCLYDEIVLIEGSLVEGFRPGRTVLKRRRRCHRLIEKPHRDRPVTIRESDPETLAAMFDLAAMVGSSVDKALVGWNNDSLEYRSLLDREKILEQALQQARQIRDAINEYLDTCP